MDSDSDETRSDKSESSTTSDEPDASDINISM